MLVHGLAPAVRCIQSRLGSGRTRGAGNKAALHAIVDGGRIPGLLAYEDGTPVGWCSVAPREEFVALESSRTLARIDDRPVWSVVCFYIDREFQRHGVGTALLEAAVDHARANGATIVEGYPSKPGDRDPFTASRRCSRMLDLNR